jgi:hypothetical protein
MEQEKDLLERIRSRPNDAPLPTEYLLDEAADEIERLWGVLDEIVTACVICVDDQHPHCLAAYKIAHSALGQERGTVPDPKQERAENSQ